jgi:phage protein D
MPPEVEIHTAHITVTINGTLGTDAVHRSVLECIVENSASLPDLCTLRLQDHDFEWTDHDTFAIGKELAIQFGPDAQHLTDVFKGEIVSLEIDLSAAHTQTVVVRALDRSHRLQTGRKRRSWQNVKDIDVFQAVAGDLGLRPDLRDQTGPVHDWVYQHNQSDWEFIQMLAQRNGARVYFDGSGKLKWESIRNGGGSTTVQLEWGMNLRSFRPRLTSQGQVNKVIVRSWDPGQKAAIVGQATTPRGIPQVGMEANGGRVAMQAFGERTMVVVDRPVHNQDAANRLAQSVLDDIAGSFIEADGLAYATPSLRPGMEVEIKNIGQKLSGKYFVTSTTHYFSPAEGLSTQFAVSGKRDGTMGDLTSQGIAGRQANGNNVVPGIVTDNNDPEGLGRVKVKYPSISDSDQSFWARLITPMAGPGRGFLFVPEVNDEVLVAFEHGDIHRPFVLGSVWNGKDAAPMKNSVRGGNTETRMIQTRYGHKLIFDDEMKYVKITTPYGHSFTIDDIGKKISAETGQKRKFEMDDTGQIITITDAPGNKIEINTSTQTISMNALMDITMTAGRNISMTAGVGFTLTAGATASFTSGASFSMTSGASFSVTSAAITTVSSAGNLTITSPLTIIA